MIQDSLEHGLMEACITTDTCVSPIVTIRRLQLLRISHGAQLFRQSQDAMSASRGIQLNGRADEYRQQVGNVTQPAQHMQQPHFHQSQQSQQYTPVLSQVQMVEIARVAGQGHF